MNHLPAGPGIKRRIWVAGHRGMVGSAILRRLAKEDVEILTVDRRDVDLRVQDAVRQWVARAKPDVIILAAAKVGGILANDSVQRISCSITSRLRRMSSRPRIWPMSSGWSFLDRLAFIRNSRGNRSRKKRC